MKWALVPTEEETRINDAIGFYLDRAHGEQAMRDADLRQVDVYRRSALTHDQKRSEAIATAIGWSSR